MGLYGTVALCTVITMLLNTGVTQDTKYYIYHHCYNEGASCGTKNISCNDNLVINIVWSIIGYSDYWLSEDRLYHNCSVTNRTCYQNVTEPSRNCSGLQTCTLYTCSNVTHQAIPCARGNATNFLHINYTCVEDIHTVSVTQTEVWKTPTPGGNMTEETIQLKPSTQSPKKSVTKTEAGMTLTPDIHTVSVTETEVWKTPTPGVNMTEGTIQLKPSAQKTIILVVSVVISTTVLIAAVVIVIFVIIKRRKTTPHRRDPKHIITSGASVKDNRDIAITESVDYLNCEDVSKTNSSLSGPSVVPVIDTNNEDVVDYVNITPRADVSYTSLGEVVSGSEVTSTTGDYEHLRPVSS